MSPRPLALSTAAVLGPLALGGCPAPDKPRAVPPTGALELCLPIPAGDDTLVSVEGIVVAVDDGTSGCARSVTLEAADGSLHTVGWTVLDDHGADRSPAADLDVGGAVAFGMRAHMVFGEVRGLRITDEGGLVLAADEGTWGGGLDPEEVGFSVEHGGVFATVEEECRRTDYARLRFTSDEMTVELAPLEEEQDFVLVADEAGIEAVSVRALASIQHGPGRSCEVSDQTDTLSWVAWR